MPGVVYGTDMADKYIRIFRVKADHTMIQIPVGDGNTEITDKDDAEIATKIFGNVQISSQDDGSHQVQFVVAEWNQEIFDFIDNYKNVASAGDKTVFTAAHGEEWGGDGSSSTDDALLVVIHGAPDADTGDIMVFTFLCSLDVGSTGNFTIQPNETTQQQLTFNQIKPKVDLVIHTGTGGSPSVLNGTVVDFSTETTDLSLLEGKFKHHFAVAAV